jgi:hypothetical protein
MRSCVAVSRTLAIIGLLALGSLLMLGCQGSNDDMSAPSTSDNALQLSTGIAGPQTPTNEDIAAAAVKPESRKDYVANFPILTISMPAGRLLELTGPNPALLIDYGCNGTIDGRVPLVQGSNHKSVMTTESFILPEGDTRFLLSQDTVIAAYVPKDETNSNYCTKLTSLCIKFTVFDDMVGPSWTLPISFNIGLNTRNGISFIKGSSLSMYWDESKGSIPPVDTAGIESVWMIGQFYRHGRMVLDSTERMLIYDAAVKFCAVEPNEFDQLDLCTDLREGHTAQPGNGTH